MLYDSNNVNTRWWTEPKQDIHKAIFGYVKYLDTKQSYSQTSNVRNLRLYGNTESYSSRGYNFLRAEPSAAVDSRVTLNIIQSMIDTVVSKVTKNKPKPTFLTDGGDWSLQRKAKRLTQFVEGQFFACDIYAKKAQTFADSCIFGTGALKIFRTDAEIVAERVFIDELIVDDSESVYGQPRQIHQKKFVHRDVLKELFPDCADKIEFLGSQEYSQWATGSFDPRTNMVLVVESWHLASSKSAKDGKHSICIENCTLFEEEWTRSYFPFVFDRWSVRPIGFWGQGLSEQLTGLQLEINKILRTIQVSMHLVSVPKLLVEASSKIVTAHLNNKIGGIIKYAGTPPQYAPLGGIPPELFSHLDRLYTRAYEIAGVSQLSATAQKPAGLNSGKALREYNDIETERFMAVGQRYEATFIQAAEIMVDLAKELDELLEGGYQVKVKGSTFMETIAWKDVDMEEDKYLMQIFPTSALSSTPAGRLQDVQELLQAGFISKEDGMKLLDFPDLRAFYNFNNAGIEDIERTIELIADKADYQTPEPYQNLQLGITKMQQAYLYYRTNGMPEERLELFRRWIEDANSLLKKAALAAAPAAPPAIPEANMQLPAAPMPEALPQEATMLPPGAPGVPV